MQSRLIASLAATMLLASVASAEDVGWDGTTYYRTAPSNDPLAVRGAPAPAPVQQFVVQQQPVTPQRYYTSSVKKSPAKQTATAKRTNGIKLAQAR